MADAHVEEAPLKHRVTQAASVYSPLGSTAKQAPAEAKVPLAVKSKAPPAAASSAASSSTIHVQPPPPPKGVSGSSPPMRGDLGVDQVEYFDMAITGLPGHFLNIPRDPRKSQEVRVSVPGAMQVVPLSPMLGSEMLTLPGVAKDKVPTNEVV